MRPSVYSILFLIIAFACTPGASNDNRTEESGMEVNKAEIQPVSETIDAEEPEVVPPDMFSSDNDKFNSFLEGFNSVSEMDASLNEKSYDTTRRISADLAGIFIPGNMTAYFAGDRMDLSEGLLGLTVHYYYRYVPEAAWMEGSYYEGSHILYFNSDGNLTGELTDAYHNEEGGDEMGGSIIKKTSTDFNWQGEFEKTDYVKHINESDGDPEYEEYEWLSSYELGSEGQITATLEKLWSYSSHEINYENRNRIAEILADLKDLSFRRVRVENGKHKVIKNGCVAASNLTIFESREDPDNYFGSGIDAWYYPIMVDENDEYGTSLITDANRNGDQITLKYISMERYRKDIPVVDMNQNRHELVFVKSKKGWQTELTDEEYLLESAAAGKLSETDYSCDQ